MIIYIFIFLSNYLTIYLSNYLSYLSIQVCEVPHRLPPQRPLHDSWHPHHHKGKNCTGKKENILSESSGIYIYYWIISKFLVFTLYELAADKIGLTHFYKKTTKLLTTVFFCTAVLYTSVLLYICPSVHLSFCASVLLYICLSVHLSFCTSVLLSF